MALCFTAAVCICAHSAFQLVEGHSCQLAFHLVRVVRERFISIQCSAPLLNIPCFGNHAKAYPLLLHMAVVGNALPVSSFGVAPACLGCLCVDRLKRSVRPNRSQPVSRFVQGLGKGPIELQSLIGRYPFGPCSLITLATNCLYTR